LVIGTVAMTETPKNKKIRGTSNLDLPQSTFVFKAPLLG